MNFAMEAEIGRALKARWDAKTKPIGSLGRLEEIVIAMGLLQGSERPRLESPTLLVFAGDHGAAARGISAYPSEVTAQMVANFLEGGAAINVLARQHDLDLLIVDAGVAADLPAHERLIDAKIGKGTKDYLSRPAMSRDDAERALQKGGEIVSTLKAQGVNAIGFGEMGIGNTGSASLITHLLTDAALVEVVGRGAGHDDHGLVRKRELLEEALRRGGKSRDPIAILSEYGGFEIAMMAGAIERAAREGVLIILDGFIVCAAALLARARGVDLSASAIFGHRSREPGHDVQLKSFGSSPLLDLGMRLGEGTGAALAFGLLRSALALYEEMASFESAGVSEAR